MSHQLADIGDVHYDGILRAALVNNCHILFCLHTPMDLQNLYIFIYLFIYLLTSAIEVNFGQNEGNFWDPKNQ